MVVIWERRNKDRIDSFFLFFRGGVFRLQKVEIKGRLPKFDYSSLIERRDAATQIYEKLPPAPAPNSKHLT